MLLGQELAYRDGMLHCEQKSLAAIAQEYGTPAYVYSRRAIEQNYGAYETALDGIPHQICYAVKANSNIAILQLIARLGAGFDIVSGGELFRVLRAGAEPRKVVFSGVGKTAAEISYALEEGIHNFNCESAAELHQLSLLAEKAGIVASVGLRVNPDVDAATHPYISTGLHEHKFGIDIKAAEELYAVGAKLPSLALRTVSCHIGSQLLSYGPLLEAADKVISLVQRLRGRGIPIRHLDLGGGLGVRYRSSDKPVSLHEFIQALKPKLAGLDLKLLLEPGRSIVGEAGILLTQVILEKQNGAKTFIIVDAAMNDLIRPTLYQAHHEIAPVIEAAEPETFVADVVGPVCESGDFFAKNRNISPVSTGDLVALQTAGAYGFVLSSNYNSRPRVPEILVSGAKATIIRRRETWEDLVRGEQLV